MYDKLAEGIQVDDVVLNANGLLYGHTISWFKKTISNYLKSKNKEYFFVSINFSIWFGNLAMLIMRFDIINKMNEIIFSCF